MALIKCEDCRNDISDKATACIYCGCPAVVVRNNDRTADNSRTSKRKAGIGIIPLVFILIIVLKFTGVLSWSWLWSLPPLVFALVVMAVILCFNILYYIIKALSK